MKTDTTVRKYDSMNISIWHLCGAIGNVSPLRFSYEWHLGSLIALT